MHGGGRVGDNPFLNSGMIKVDHFGLAHLAGQKFHSQELTQNTNLGTFFFGQKLVKTGEYFGSKHEKKVSTF